MLPPEPVAGTSSVAGRCAPCDVPLLTPDTQVPSSVDPSGASVAVNETRPPTSPNRIWLQAIEPVAGRWLKNPPTLTKPENPSEKSQSADHVPDTVPVNVPTQCPLSVGGQGSAPLGCAVPTSNAATATTT